MRISSNQLANLVKQSVADNTQRLYKAQETVSTQKRVNRPSDDPLAMGRMLNYRSTLATVDQYVRNIDQARLQIEFSEKQVEEAQSRIQSAKTLVIGLASDDETLREQAAGQIQDIYDQLLDIANTKLGNDYIFAGHRNGPAPVDCAEISCSSASELKGGDAFTIGDDSGYRVWYSIDGEGSAPTLSESESSSGMTLIEVPISADDSASEVADKTVTAISGVDTLSGGATVSDPKRIEILDDGTPPYIADNSTDFTLRTVKYEETAPFTKCAEISSCNPSDLENGDYFTLGEDAFVWYDTLSDPSGVPDVAGRANAIQVDIQGAVTAHDMATRTAEAINDEGTYQASVTEDDKIHITLSNSDDVPEIAKESDNNLSLHTVQYNGDDGRLQFAVSKTLKIQGNATGNEVFTGEGLNAGVNVFDTLKALKDAFESTDYDEDLVSNLKDDLIKGMEQVEKAAIDLSVNYTRLESTENYWDGFKFTVQNMLSEEEDADLAQAIVELQHQETVYEASLAASAKLFKQSLLDFLG